MASIRTHEVGQVGAGSKSLTPPQSLTVSEENIIQKLCRSALKLLHWLTFLPPLLTRVIIGYAFYQTGKGKLGNLEHVTDFFQSLGIPFPHANAIFIGTLECVGGIMLIIGLFTRPIAALLTCTMIVALATADYNNFVQALKGMGDKGLTDVVPVVFGLFLIWLVVYGPGLASVDAIIRKALHIDRRSNADSETETP